MRSTRPLLIVLLLALGLGFLALTRVRDGGEAAVPGPAGAPEIRPPAPPTSLAVGDERAPGPAARSAAPTADTAVAEGAVEAEAEATPTLIGRLVDEDGRPLAGVALDVRGWPSNQTLVREHGDPGRVELEFASDADGRFRVFLDAHPASQYVVETRAPGRGSLGWRMSALEPERTYDLGEHVLARAAVLAVRVVDEAGEPLVEGWSPYAEPSGRALGGYREDWPIRRSTGRTYDQGFDAASGRYEIAGLDPGIYDVGAVGPMQVEASQRRVTVEAGERVEVELVHSGGDRSQDLEISLRTPMRLPLDLPEEAVRLVTAGGAEVGFELTSGLFGTSVRAAGLPPGLVDLFVDHPSVESTRRLGLEPGRRYGVTLAGSAALALEVVDAATDAAVVPTRVELAFPILPAGARPRSPAPLHDLLGDEPFPADGLLTGVFPWRSELRVEADGFAPFALDLGPIAPGETRAMRVALDSPRDVAVRLVWPDGRPARAYVGLFAAGELSPIELYDRERADGRPMPMPPEPLERATTDPDGVVRFEGLAPGRHGLHVEGGYVFRAWFGEVPAVEPGGAPLELVLPPAGRIAGSATLREGVELGLTWIALERDLPYAISAPLSTPRPANPVATTVVGPRDDFEFDALLPGTYAVHLCNPGATRFDVRLGERLAEVTVEAGRTARLDLDLAAHLPTALELEVTVDGRPANGYEVRLARLLEQGPDGATAHADVTLDAEGRGTLDGLPPGLWSAQLVLSDGWRRVALAAAPRDVRLVPGETARLAFDVPTATASVRVLGTEDGRGLMLGHQPADLGPAFGPSNARSSLPGPEFPLRLAVGRHVFRLYRSDPGVAPPPGPPVPDLERTVAWPPPGGELVLELP